MALLRGLPALEGALEDADVALLGDVKLSCFNLHDAHRPEVQRACEDALVLPFLELGDRGAVDDTLCCGIAPRWFG